MRWVLVMLALAACGRAEVGSDRSIVEEFDPTGKIVLKRTTTCSFNANGGTWGKDVGLNGTICDAAFGVNSNQNEAFVNALARNQEQMNENLKKVLDITAPLAKAAVLAPK